MNSLQVIESLITDRKKCFLMTNYADLRKEYPRQISSDVIMNFGGKICYAEKGYKVVELSYVILYECKWEEIE